MSKNLCPLLKKTCIEHDCKFYVHVQGMHPQTGAPMDHWDCAVSWVPMLMVESARMTRCVAASVDSMRNEVVQRQDALNDAVAKAQTGRLGVNHEARIVDVDGSGGSLRLRGESASGDGEEGGGTD